MKLKRRKRKPAAYLILRDRELFFQPLFEVRSVLSDSLLQILLQIVDSKLVSVIPFVEVGNFLVHSPEENVSYFSLWVVHRRATKDKERLRKC